MKHAISTRRLANPNHQGRSHFPHNFWSLFNNLLHYQSKDFLCSLDDHVGHPPPQNKNKNKNMLTI
jgi:hypothetical protein